MRWSYILIGAVLLTAATISSYRLLDLPKQATGLLIGALVAVIIISLLGVVSRLRE